MIVHVPFKVQVKRNIGVSISEMVRVLSGDVFLYIIVGGGRRLVFLVWPCFSVWWTKSGEGKT